MLSGFLFKVCTAFEEGKTEPQLISSLSEVSEGQYAYLKPCRCLGTLLDQDRPG